MAEATDDYIVTSLAPPDEAPIPADTASPAVETSVPESAPDTSVAPETTETTTDEPSDDTTDDEPVVSKNNLDRRFRRLTGTIRELKAENQRLQRDFELLRTPTPPPAAGQPGASREPVAPPAVSGPPRPEDFADYDAYVQALVDTRAQQLIEDRFRQQDQTAQEQRELEAQEAQAKGYATRLAAAKGRYSDYDEVLDGADFPVSPALLEELHASEQGPDLAYYLAQHPDEGVRLSQLPPRALARELGRLEAQLHMAVPVPVPVPTPTPEPVAVAPSTRPAVPTRPRPLTPVNSAQGSTSEPVFDPATATFEEFKRWRASGGGRG